MLNEAYQKNLWDNWLSAEIRAGYFAALSSDYKRSQMYYTIGSLVCSSGAAASFIVTVFPPEASLWIRVVLTTISAILSAVTLASRKESTALSCTDLHYRWNRLAMEYGNLWADVYADDALDKFHSLQKEEAEISKSSTGLPGKTKTRLLKSIQKTIMMQHGAPA